MTIASKIYERDWYIIDPLIPEQKELLFIMAEALGLGIEVDTRAHTNDDEYNYLTYQLNTLSDKKEIIAFSCVVYDWVEALREKPIVMADADGFYTYGQVMYMFKYLIQKEVENEELDNQVSSSGT